MKKRSSAVLAVFAVAVAAFLAFSASALAVAAFPRRPTRAWTTMAPSSLASTSRSRQRQHRLHAHGRRHRRLRLRQRRWKAPAGGQQGDQSTSDVSDGGSFEPKNGRVRGEPSRRGAALGRELLLPGWPAPRARRRLVHEHRADGHDERREHQRPRRLEDVLRRLSSQLPAGATLGGFWRRDGLDHGGAQSSPWQPAGVVAPLPQPGKGHSITTPTAGRCACAVVESLPSGSQLPLTPAVPLWP